MDIIDIRTGKISYTTTIDKYNSFYGDPLFKNDFIKYTWTYSIELYSTEIIILYLYVDIEKTLDDKKDTLRIGAQYSITLNHLYNIKLSKYNICRDMLDKLYKEIHTKHNIKEIPESQKTEFDNKIIYDYMDIWHYTMK
jgi:hypothetical protein